MRPIAAEEAEMPVAALQEMLGRQAAHRLVIDVHQRHPQPRHGTRRVDDRLAQLEHFAGKLLGEQLGDDAVRLPLPECLDDGRLGRAVLEDPIGLVDGVRADAADHVAAEAHVLAHEEGDAPGFAHRCGFPVCWPAARAA